MGYKDKVVKAETLGDLHEHIVHIARVAKVVKGGKRFSFSALVVVGDRAGHVGVGMGKANEVPDAIRKGTEAAKKSMVAVPLVGRTIPHRVIGRNGAGEVMLRPASEGTGVIAGGAMRSLLEAAGVKDVLAKILGTANPHNVINATLDALKQLESLDTIARRRGKRIEDVIVPRSSHTAGLPLEAIGKGA